MSTTLDDARLAALRKALRADRTEGEARQGAQAAASALSQGLAALQQGWQQDDVFDHQLQKLEEARESLLGT
jgi:hypothetical protein